MTYGGAGEDRVLCGFHDHLVGRAPGALLGLVVPKLLTDARHRRLRTVLRVRGIRPVVRVTRGQSEPDHTGGRLRGRGGQPVQPVGWRHLFKGIQYYRCYQPSTWWPHLRFKAQYCSGVAAPPPPPASHATLYSLGPIPATLKTLGPDGWSKRPALCFHTLERQAVPLLLLFKPRYSS